MTLSFRPDMKAIVHEVDGRPVTVIGRTIDTDSTALVAMMEAHEEADRLRAGARVRCSYVDHQGVHEFVSTVRSAEPLALNHRLLRLAIDPPSSAERVQRREHVRVDLALPVVLVDPAEDTRVSTTSVDLSAGGMCLVWPADIPEVEPGAMVEVGFSSERFDHHHEAQVLGSYQRGKVRHMRVRFEGISPAGRDRLATVVAAAQRDQLRRQREEE